MSGRRRKALRKFFVANVKKSVLADPQQDRAVWRKFKKMYNRISPALRLAGGLNTRG